MDELNNNLDNVEGSAKQGLGAHSASDTHTKHDYVSSTPYGMQYGSSSLRDQVAEPTQYNFHLNADNIDSLEAMAPEPEQMPGKPKTMLRNIISIAVTIVLIFVCARLLNMFVMQSYTIPSGSMEDTIMIKDLVFAEKMTYHFSDPKQGEIITFIDPETYGDNTADQRILIKRVIATGGQTIDLRDGYVYIDGVKQDEPYTDGKPTYPLSGSHITYPYTVPEGEVWVMGDNRTNSQDSRYFGSIPVDSVQGHALFIYWPLSEIAWL